MDIDITIKNKKNEIVSKFLSKYDISRFKFKVKQQAESIKLLNLIHVDYGIYHGDKLSTLCGNYLLLLKYNKLKIPSCKTNYINVNTKDSNYIFFQEPIITNNLLYEYAYTIYYINDTNKIIMANNIDIDYTKNNYYIFHITIINNSLFHANCLLIDHLKKIIIRFEPHGALTLDSGLDEHLKSYFVDLKHYTYYSPQDYCPLNGLQTLSNELDNDIKIKNDPLGYCLSWCFWFIELYFNNLNVNIKNLIYKTINKLIINNIQIISHIRDYSHYINTEIQSVYKSLNIDLNIIARDNAKYIEALIKVHKLIVDLNL
jgi:hypothetical protein